MPAGLARIWLARRQAGGYSATVHLPVSSFPVHLKQNDRLAMDKRLARLHDVQAVYERQLAAEKPDFWLLDGPPYANGPAHLGHAVNKIFKDIIVRYKVMTGHRVHFRPGWDCHGLPVELKALKLAADPLEPAKVRRLARTVAEESIASQMGAFKQWAVLADWAHPYRTFDKDYQAMELNLFRRLYRSGMIFRAFKPVYWSPTSKTALAEAELVYNQDHCSLAVFFKFAVINFPKQLFSILPTATVWAVVWTTTPWTLAVNDAICYNENLQYCLVATTQGSKIFAYYLIGSESVHRFEEAINKQVRVLQTFPGSLLRGLLYSMPVQPDLAYPFYDGRHVREGHGTGLVHTAFAHGFEDYEVGLSRGRRIVSLVDKEGRYEREMGPPLAGRHCLTDGQEVFLDQVAPGHVMARRDFVHAYPYDWRTNQPVIIRASKQWFLDTDRLKAKAVELLKQEVQMFPENLSKAMQDTVGRRPLWCISRQRVWGTPLPVFYDQDTDEPVVDDDILDNVVQLLTDRGVDAWWSLGVSNLLPSNGKASRRLRKGDEVLDVWFDSGMAWHSSRENAHNDLVIEGVDQLRGWFQSLLLTSIADGRRAPYRHIVVHGFVQDEEGRKMSKSVGNVVLPDLFIHGGKLGNESITALGVDGLRLWVASCCSEGSNVRLGPDSIAAVRKSLVQIRSVLRFISGVLNDFHPAENNCTYDQLSTVDKYMLSLLANYIEGVTALYDKYRILNVVTKALQFINGDVSNFYCTVAKHRLYCSGKDSVMRRSVQTVLHHVVSACVRSIAPCLPYLAEEFREHLVNAFGRTVLESGWPTVADEWRSDNAVSRLKPVLSARSAFLSAHGCENTLQHTLCISANADILCSFRSVHPLSELLDLFQVSSVQLREEAESVEPSFHLSLSPLKLCPRCRRYCCQEADEICSGCMEACQ